MKLVENELLSGFESQSKTKSLQMAAKVLLRQLGIRVEVEGGVPLEGPVLIVANHPGSVDDLVLMSTVYRRDLMMVAMAGFQRLGTELSKQLFPIYRKEKTRDGLVDRVMPGLQVHVLRDMEERRRRNRLSIKKAAEAVNRGKAVAIFPTGDAGDKPEWGSFKVGVGYLARQITNPQSKVVFVKIEGTNKRDILRYLRWEWRRVMFRQKTVKVKFSKALGVKEIIKNASDEKWIAWQFEKAYGHELGVGMPTWQMKVNSLFLVGWLMRGVRVVMEGWRG